MELSKVKPNIEVPFRCYIYCTMRKAKRPDEILEIHTPDAKIHRGNGRVIGEFLCDKIDKYSYDYCDGVDIDDDTILETAMGREDINIRAKGKPLYGWHISKLKIYEEPKPLFEFHKYGAQDMTSVAENLCEYCSDTDYGGHRSCVCPSGYVSCEGRFCCEAYEQYLDENFSIVSPPKSWIYVEGLL